MLGSLNNTELIGLLSSMKVSAPSTVYQYILDSTKSVLVKEGWLKMKVILGV